MSGRKTANPDAGRPRYDDGIREEIEWIICCGCGNDDMATDKESMRQEERRKKLQEEQEILRLA